MSYHHFEVAESTFHVPPGEQPVMQLYGNLVEGHRILYPQGDTIAIHEAEQRLLQTLTTAHESGKHIVVGSGGFDIPHSNHTWFLRHVRMRGARAHFGPAAFDVADRLSQQAMVASDEVMLVVNMQTDAKTAALKGADPKKLGVSLPVYPWQERADRIGGLTIPDGKGTYRSVVDLIVAEGDPEFADTIFADYLEFSKSLLQHKLVDTLVVFGEHPTAVATIKAHEQAYAGENAGIVEMLHPAEAGFVINPRTGINWSSTAIMRHVIDSARSD
jgi:hypothetical protein